MNFKTAALICFVSVFPSLGSAQEAFDFPVAASSKVLGYAPLWVAAGKVFSNMKG
jgi:hypothetical protein